jgi:hypothetical protein
VFNAGLLGDFAPAGVYQLESDVMDFGFKRIEQENIL